MSASAPLTDAQFDEIKQRLGQDPHHTYPYALLAGTPPPPASLFSATISTRNTTSYGDLLESNLILPWDGSTPAFRALCFAKVSAGTVTFTLGVALAAQSAGEAEGSYDTEFGDTALSITTAYKLIDTGWVTPAAMPTLDDTLAVSLRGKISDNSDAKSWKSFSLYVDWNYNR